MAQRRKRRNTPSSQTSDADVQDYRHAERRLNNPPAGLVSYEVARRFGNSVHGEQDARGAPAEDMGAVGAGSGNEVRTIRRIGTPERLYALEQMAAQVAGLRQDVGPTEGTAGGALDRPTDRLEAPRAQVEAALRTEQEDRQRLRQALGRFARADTLERPDQALRERDTELRKREDTRRAEAQVVEAELRPQLDATQEAVDRQPGLLLRVSAAVLAAVAVVGGLVVLLARV